MGDILITVNGEDREYPSEVKIPDVLESLGLSSKGIAVAVNGIVSARCDWNQPLSAGAIVEILTAVPGG